MTTDIKKNVAGIKAIQEQILKGKKDIRKDE